MDLRIAKFFKDHDFSSVMSIFENIVTYLQPFFPRTVFYDRQKAGQILGNNLKTLFKSKKKENSAFCNDSILVMGIPRGGLVVAHEIAQLLNCDLDLIYPVRILDENSETTIGSILPINRRLALYNSHMDVFEHSFSIYMNDQIAEEYLRANKSRILQTVLEKTMKYGSVMHRNIQEKSIILVDDGVFSGASAIVALRWIRTHQPKELIFATPVAPSEIVTKIKTDTKISIDHLEILKIPSSTDYKTVDYYYKNFEDIEDQWINNIIKNFINN